MIAPAQAPRRAEVGAIPAAMGVGEAPERLPAPTAGLIILGLSLSLWAVLGAGAAWVAGWL